MRYAGAVEPNSLFVREAFLTEVASRGAWTPTSAELELAGRVAWRNSTRCIGRLFWRSLSVRDRRDCATAEEIFEALADHVRWSTNGGRIRPLMTVFAPGVRILNPQLVRYADDPVVARHAERARALGWAGGEFLPLMIRLPGDEVRLFDLPPEDVLEVRLEHPEEPRFAGLGLKWHALPAVSDMRLEVGGHSYSAAPFSGWYMGTEIGSRNLGDTARYDALPRVAAVFGLDTRSQATLWRDRALVELNRAVLHSYAKAGVTIVDHHTASEQFLLHEERETCLHARRTYGDWAWLVPPLSGSASPIFHRKYEDRERTPGLFRQEDDE